MSKHDGSRRRVLTRDERVLWTNITHSIAPLREGAREPDIEAEPAAAKPPPAARKPKPVAVPASGTKSRPRLPRSPQLTPLSRRMRRSVARGKEAIDARLDLHGLTQAQAHSALSRFLR